MQPPVTDHVPLHGKALSKKYAPVKLGGGGGTNKKDPCSDLKMSLIVIKEKSNNN